jgi:hypothetical protein
MVDVIKVGKWYVQAISPRDSYEEVSLLVTDWINKSMITDFNIKIEKYYEAYQAVQKHSFWEYHEREEPRVSYDIVHDEEIFIFKIDNNGTTFIVSQREMLELERA